MIGIFDKFTSPIYLLVNGEQTEHSKNDKSIILLLITLDTNIYVEVLKVPDKTRISVMT